MDQWPSVDDGAGPAHVALPSCTRTAQNQAPLCWAVLNGFSECGWQHQKRFRSSCSWVLLQPLRLLRLPCFTAIHDVGLAVGKWAPGWRSEVANKIVYELYPNQSLSFGGIWGAYWGQCSELGFLTSQSLWVLGLSQTANHTFPQLLVLNFFFNHGHNDQKRIKKERKFTSVLEFLMPFFQPEMRTLP